MSDDVLITPASRKIEFKDSGGTVDAKIETDSSGNLTITNPGGDISLGDTTADVFIGDGVNSVDLVFEQNGEIRGTSGVTLTLGDSNTTLRTGTDLSLNSNDITNVGAISTETATITDTITGAGAATFNSTLAVSSTLTALKGVITDISSNGRGIFRNNTGYDLRLGGGTDISNGAYISLSGHTRGGVGNSQTGRLEYHTGGNTFSNRASVLGDHVWYTNWNGGNIVLMHIDSSTGHLALNMGTDSAKQALSVKGASTIAAGDTFNHHNTQFSWHKANTGSTGANVWYKVADITVPDVAYSAVSMEIYYETGLNNFGNNDYVDIQEVFCTITRNSTSATNNSPDNAVLKGRSTDVRVYKTATGTYQLQARHAGANSSYNVRVRVYKGNENVTITPAGSGSTPGATSGGTAYTVTSAISGNDGIKHFIGQMNAEHVHVTSGTSADASIIIESDTDNNNENDNPQLMFRQDAGITIAKAGLTGDAGQIYTDSLGNAAYFGNDENASVQLYTNTTARMTILGTGNVGINTNNPADQLEIRDNHSQLRLTDSDDSKFIQFSYSGTKLTIRNNNSNTSTNQVTLDSIGSLGVGTMSPNAKINTGTYFKPESTGRFVSINAPAGGFLMLESSTLTDNDQIGGLYFTATSGQADAHRQVAGIDAIVDAHSTNTVLNGADLRFFTKPKGGGTSVPRMTIRSTGNVGIGTDDPLATLDVRGDIELNSTYPVIRFKDSDSENDFSIIGSSGLFRIYDEDAAAARLAIKSDGNVGIGTDNPSSKLHLYKGSLGANTGVTDMLCIELNRSDHSTTPSGPAILFKDQDTNNPTNEARIKMMTVNDTDYGDNDEASSNLLFETTDGGVASDKMIITGRGVVGIGEVSPLGTGLHVKTGDAGAFSANGNHDDLIVEGSGNTGIQIMSPNANYQYLAFGDPDAVNAGYIRYYHSSNEMTLRAGAKDTVRITEDGLRLAQKGTATGSSAQFNSGTLQLTASGWDTNNNVARSVSWKIRNVPTASVYPDHDLKFIESDQGNEYTKFEIHGRGSTNHTDPKAATFYGNVSIEGGGTGVNAGPGELSVHSTFTITAADSEQTDSADSTTVPDSAGTPSMKIQSSSYTDGRYTTRIAKIDRSGGLPLYFQESLGTANSYTNRMRVGTHSRTNGDYPIETFGPTMIGGRIGIQNGEYIRRHTASWQNAPQHTVLHNSFKANLGDYVTLKAAGNKTSGHGAITVADNGIFFGRSNAETGELVANNDASNPLDTNYGHIDATGLNVKGTSSTFYSSEASNALAIGRNTNEKLEITVTDSNVEIEAHQDSDGNAAHTFKLNRTFAGTGANDFQIQKGGSAQLKIDTNGSVQILDGTGGTPSLSFMNDTNTGIYRVGTDHLGIRAGSQYNGFNVSSTTIAHETGITAQHPVLTVDTWLKIAKIDSRGGSKIICSYTGGDKAPTTYVITAYKDWSTGTAMSIEKLGNGDHIKKARIKTDTDGKYYVELLFAVNTANYNFYIYHQRILGYDSATTIYTGTLPASGTGTVYDTLNFPSDDGYSNVGSVEGGSLMTNQYIYHRGDTDTHIRMSEDRLRFVAGNSTFFDLVESTTNYIHVPQPRIRVGSTAVAPNAVLELVRDSTATPSDGAGSDAHASLRITNTNTTTGASSTIIFNANDSTGASRHGAAIQFKKASLWSGAGSYPGELYFWTRPSVGNQVPALKLDKDGDGIFRGNVTAYGSLSDRKLKENIENIPNAVEKVQKLNGVTFNYKKDGKKATGLIAQDLQEVLPEAVYTTEDLETKEERLAIHYGNVVGLLVEALKEQQTKIDNLTALVNELKEK